MANETQIRGRNDAGEKRFSILFLLKSLLFSYILTAVLLVILSFLLYKMELSEKPVAIAIITIYVVATLFVGFVTGKRMRSKKFLWGLFMGGVYFLVLAVISLGVKQDPETLGNTFFTTLALCVGGGMLGGMLS